MQTPPDRGPSVARELKQLTHLLALTSDQQTQVKAILDDRHSKIETLFKHAQDSASSGNSPDGQPGSGTPPSRDSMDKLRAEADTIRKDANARIAAVLSDDQKVKFSAWVDRHARQGDDMPPPPDDGNGPPPGGDGGPPPGGGGPPPSA
jgi:hypothetical protein